MGQYYTVTRRGWGGISILRIAVPSGTGHSASRLLKCARLGVSGHPVRRLIVRLFQFFLGVCRDGTKYFVYRLTVVVVVVVDVCCHGDG